MKTAAFKTLSVCFALALAVVVVFAFKKPVDPVYNGRHLSEWYQELKESGGPRSDDAEKAIGQIGEDALPFLLEQIEPEKPSFGESALDWFNTNIRHRHKYIGCGLEIISREFTAEIRISKAFSALGSKSDAALPRLKAQLLRPETASRASAALKTFGQRSIEIYRNGLATTNADIREAIILQLAKMKECSNEAAGLLFTMQQDPDPSIRQLVTNAIGELESDVAKQN